MSMYTGAKTVVRTVYGVNANLDLLDKFRYLGDMLSVDGDAHAAVENRTRNRWSEFRHLIPLLTNKYIYD